MGMGTNYNNIINSPLIYRESTKIVKKDKKRQNLHDQTNPKNLK